MLLQFHWNWLLVGQLEKRERERTGIGHMNFERKVSVPQILRYRRYLPGNGEKKVAQLAVHCSPHLSSPMHQVPSPFSHSRAKDFNPRNFALSLTFKSRFIHSTHVIQPAPVFLYLSLSPVFELVSLSPRSLSM